MLKMPTSTTPSDHFSFTCFMAASSVDREPSEEAAMSLSSGILSLSARSDPGRERERRRR